ncbi:MAG TPA: 3-oxoacyl-[acyl-carrier-protein] synthase III C-terminal domain-containing protein [Candidatus Eisenbacteria bacterium]|nr:3-oxoacyl-[acyl-carrier-protein] synthase III C-terminal domain-containing protein [Candidatus Eisenbacteria bacterium]
MTPARLLSLATAVPPHVIRQGDAKRLIEALFSAAPGSAGDPEGGGAGGRADWARLYSVFDHGAIETRRSCMPLEWYAEPHGFRERNDRYLEHAVGLSAEASLRALERGGLSPRDVDHIVFVSSTGLATPSVDAMLVNRLGLPSRVRRTPVWGLGCAGGAAGLARAGAFAQADPGSRVLVVALELCSLTFQRGDRTKRNLVAASLFGDGAAAAVLAAEPSGASRRASGARRALDLVSSAATFWHDTLDVMGWDVDGDGLHVVFSRDIPAIVRTKVRESAEAFLGAEGLRMRDIRRFAAHPGGLKVLDAYRDALELDEEAVRVARDVLREFGNMSAPTCLFVLDRFLERDEIAAGDHVLVTALGPGFSAEYVLLRGVSA